ncbi:related to Endo-1,6-beta-D-glucanase BGN16.3 [Ramularia collo-cygni]|uniref:Related to Endo-1,6-beta-D-glucanase BGN16.3 n=1 Tax=Ramularia collo-cygni TaxID=112498 RepID=A0A2D3UZR3_9PEZI|nr:related to Endo-1,6-beta-D-glucanase BGN16.3 [Ramularia collo-cygni]CZT14719.1 related to Endo-1,6-beta-D-glucanase BGN16.3 [Ramularia collo-cygni]
MLSHILLALAGSTHLAYALPLGARDDGAQAYSTNHDLAYKNSKIDAPKIGKDTSVSIRTWDLSIDDTGAGDKQVVTGFGGCVTDATVTSFGSLSSDSLNSLLEEMKHFNLLRHTIASSDLSGAPAYTYDDNNNQADPSLRGFNLGDRGNAMVSLISTMKSLNSNMHLLGSPWSPPAWMKRSRKLLGTQGNNLDDGTNLNDGSKGSGYPGLSQSFADYFVKYIQAFNDAGATVNAITIQNEPLNSKSNFPTMYVFAEESANLINEFVGPALRNANTSIPVWAYDHNTDRPDYPETVMNVAGDFVDATAWHCYAPTPDWNVLSEFHEKFPNKKQYMTECYTTADLRWDQVATFTMGPLQNWASGAIAWTLGTDDSFGPHLDGDACQNCRGLVTANSNGYTLTNDYYVMAQFSKYIPQDATILNGSGSYTYTDGNDNGKGIQSVASRNPDGTKTVVIWNSLDDEHYVTTTFGSGKVWSGNVPGKSVTSWILP